jgi:hypothetical protein
MDIEQSNKRAMREKTSRFGKGMAKTQKIINTGMVVDARAQGMSLWHPFIGRLKDCFK